MPGSPTAAVLLGGLLIWGLQPGPMLFVEQKDFVWGLIASMYLGNPRRPHRRADLRADVRRDPARPLFSIIAPLILVLCAIGAYSVHSSTFDVVLMLVFGVIGYLLKKCTIRSPRWCWRSCSATRRKRPSGSRCWDPRARLGDLLQHAGGTIMILGLIALFWSVIQEGYSRLRGGARLMQR